MTTVVAAKVPKDKATTSRRSLYATVCYYYNQYKLEDVQAMPARDLVLLVKTAHKIEARTMYHLTQVAAAPHTKNGSAVKELLSEFKKGMK